MESNKPKGNELLDAYAKATEAWTKSFQTMQEQAASAFKLYIQGFEQAMKASNFDEMKKYAKQFPGSCFKWDRRKSSAGAT